MVKCNRISGKSLQSFRDFKHSSTEKILVFLMDSGITLTVTLLKLGRNTAEFNKNYQSFQLKSA